MGATIAYCPVSSRDQNPELQLDALGAHGHDRLFAEKESGKRGVERPEFTAALSALQAGDTLVFWKSDRWGLSAAHVLTTISELRDRGVTVKSLTENFDLNTIRSEAPFSVSTLPFRFDLHRRWRSDLGVRGEDGTAGGPRGSGDGGLTSASRR